MKPPRLAWAERGRTREVLLDVPVVCIEAPDLEPSDLLAFAATLGDVTEQPRVRFRLDGDPRLMVVGNVRDAGGVKRGASALRYGYHSDMSWSPDAPDLTLLYARTVPAEGGDTLFRCLYRLHDTFDAETLASWRALEVRHETASEELTGRPGTHCIHPLVRTHPESGRGVLFASPAYARHVLGLPADRSQALLERVHAAATTPDWTHRWAVDDLLVWDNRAVLHSATAHDPDATRCLWRATVRVP